MLPTATTVRALGAGWGAPAVIALIATSSLVAFVGPTFVDLPRIGGGGPVVSPLASLCAWAVALAAVRSAAEPSATLFATAPRVAVQVNVCRVALVAATGVASLVIASDVGAAGVWTATAALVGEGLLCASVLGPPLGWLPPTTHVMAATVMGAANRRDLAPWAWFLEPSPNLAQVAISTLMVALGLACWSFRARAVARDRGASDF